MAADPNRSSTSPLFSASPKADIILRSSDNVDFYASSYFLSYASPVFDGMFSIPSPIDPNEGNEIKDGLPLLPMAEDSLILERILLLCYPMNHANLDDIFVRNAEDAIALHLVLHKYDMIDSWTRLRRHLLQSPLIRTDPLRAFAVGHRLRNADITKLAARYLSAEFVFDARQRVNADYANFTYLQLLQAHAYHLECVKVVNTALNDLETKGDLLYTYTPGDDHRDVCQNTTWFRWWCTYFFSLKEQVTQNACGAFASGPIHQAAVMKQITDAGCAACSATVARELPRLGEVFHECVEAEIAKIELALEW
ncbi:hypothetical protein HWV62_37346 [Athelia sp. TMB]|nr:hypothetical protein HWV62_37346 [Athelia sp. TMB]